MANGFCPYLLQTIGEITKDANPMYKVQPNGFTSMLMLASTPGLIKNDSYNGHTKTVQVKKRQRFTKEQTDTVASCDNTLVPAYTEDTVSVASFRQLAFHIEDETIAKYCDDASRTVAVGKPPTTYMMAEIVDTMMSAANALLRGVNDDLIALNTFGKNVVEGNSSCTTINLPKDVTVQPLDDGVTKILSDYKKNGLSGRPQIVGQGLMLNWVMQQFAKSADQSGIDTKILAGAFDFWNDDDWDSIIGTNKIGVFEPNSLQIVEYLRYQGFKAGEKPGGSVFGILPLPMIARNEVVPVYFDFQFKYNDCAQSFTDAYTGQSITLEKGWNMILSKQFGLYQIPNNAYRAEDPKYGVNGAICYTVANNCDTCN